MERGAAVVNGQVEILSRKLRELFIASSRFRVLWLFLLPPFGQRQQQARAVSLFGRERFAYRVQVPSARHARLSAACSTPAPGVEKCTRMLNVCRPATTPANACPEVQIYPPCMLWNAPHVQTHLIGNLRSPLRAETRAPSAMPTTNTKLVARPRPAQTTGTSKMYCKA